MQPDIVFVGNYSYSISTANNTVVLSADELENTSSTSTSGTIRLELWLTTTPWNSGGSNTGYEIATYRITGSSNGTLGPDQYFSNVSNTVTYVNHPPAGSYYVTLAAAEYRPAWCWPRGPTRELALREKTPIAHAASSSA